MKFKEFKKLLSILLVVASVCNLITVFPVWGGDSERSIAIYGTSTTISGTNIKEDDDVAWSDGYYWSVKSAHQLPYNSDPTANSYDSTYANYDVDIDGDTSGKYAWSVTNNVIKDEVELNITGMSFYVEEFWLSLPNNVCDDRDPNGSHDYYFAIGYVYKDSSGNETFYEVTSAANTDSANTVDSTSIISSASEKDLTSMLFSPTDTNNFLNFKTDGTYQLAAEACGKIFLYNATFTVSHNAVDCGYGWKLTTATTNGSSAASQSIACGWTSDSTAVSDCETKTFNCASFTLNSLWLSVGDDTEIKDIGYQDAAGEFYSFSNSGNNEAITLSSENLGSSYPKEANAAMSFTGELTINAPGTYKIVAKITNNEYLDYNITFVVGEATEISELGNGYWYGNTSGITIDSTAFSSVSATDGVYYSYQNITIPSGFGVTVPGDSDITDIGFLNLSSNSFSSFGAITTANDSASGKDASATKYVTLNADKEFSELGTYSLAAILADGSIVCYPFKVTISAEVVYAENVTEVAYGSGYRYYFEEAYINDYSTNINTAISTYPIKALEIDSLNLIQLWVTSPYDVSTNPEKEIVTIGYITVPSDGCEMVYTPFDGYTKHSTEYKTVQTEDASAKQFARNICSNGCKITEPGTYKLATKLEDGSIIVYDFMFSIKETVVVKGANNSTNSGKSVNITGDNTIVEKANGSAFNYCLDYVFSDVASGTTLTKNSANKLSNTNDIYVYSSVAFCQVWCAVGDPLGDYFNIEEVGVVELDTREFIKFDNSTCSLSSRIGEITNTDGSRKSGYTDVDYMTGYSNTKASDETTFNGYYLLNTPGHYKLAAKLEDGTIIAYTFEFFIKSSTDNSSTTYYAYKKSGLGYYYCIDRSYFGSDSTSNVTVQTLGSDYSSGTDYSTNVNGEILFCKYGLKLYRLWVSSPGTTGIDYLGYVNLDTGNLIPIYDANSHTGESQNHSLDPVFSASTARTKKGDNTINVGYQTTTGNDPSNTNTRGLTAGHYRLAAVTKPNGYRVVIVYDFEFYIYDSTTGLSSGNNSFTALNNSTSQTVSWTMSDVTVDSVESATEGVMTSVETAVAVGTKADFSNVAFSKITFRDFTVSAPTGKTISKIGYYDTESGTYYDFPTENGSTIELSLGTDSSTNNVATFSSTDGFTITKNGTYRIVIVCTDGTRYAIAPELRVGYLHLDNFTFTSTDSTKSVASKDIYDHDYTMYPSGYASDNSEYGHVAYYAGVMTSDYAQSLFASGDFAVPDDFEFKTYFIRHIFTAYDKDCYETQTVTTGTSAHGHYDTWVGEYLNAGLGYTNYSKLLSMGKNGYTTEMDFSFDFSDVVGENGRVSDDTNSNHEQIDDFRYAEGIHQIVIYLVDEDYFAAKGDNSGNQVISSTPVAYFDIVYIVSDDTTRPLVNAVTTILTEQVKAQFTLRSDIPFLGDIVQRFTTDVEYNEISYDANNNKYYPSDGDYTYVQDQEQDKIDKELLIPESVWLCPRYARLYKDSTNANFTLKNPDNSYMTGGYSGVTSLTMWYNNYYFSDGKIVKGSEVTGYAALGLEADYYYWENYPTPEYTTCTEEDTERTYRTFYVGTKKYVEYTIGGKQYFTVAVYEDAGITGEATSSNNNEYWIVDSSQYTGLTEVKDGYWIDSGETNYNSKGIVYEENGVMYWLDDGVTVTRAAKNMCDDMYVGIYYEGNLLQTLETSISEIFYTIANTSATEIPNCYRNLARALLVYGDAAQQYFNYKTGEHGSNLEVMATHYYEDNNQTVPQIADYTQDMLLATDTETFWKYLGKRSDGVTTPATVEYTYKKNGEDVTETCKIAYASLILGDRVSIRFRYYVAGKDKYIYDPDMDYTLNISEYNKLLRYCYDNVSTYSTVTKTETLTYGQICGLEDEYGNRIKDANGNNITMEEADPDTETKDDEDQYDLNKLCEAIYEVTRAIEYYNDSTGTTNKTGTGTAIATKTIAQRIAANAEWLSEYIYNYDSAKNSNDAVEGRFIYGNAIENPAVKCFTACTCDNLPEHYHFSCDRYVDWVLYLSGYTDQPAYDNSNNGGATIDGSLADYLASLGFTLIDDKDELECGDIVFYYALGDNGEVDTNSIGHVFIFEGYLNESYATDNDYSHDRYEGGTLGEAFTYTVDDTTTTTQHYIYYNANNNGQYTDNTNSMVTRFAFAYHPVDYSATGSTN